MALNQFVPRVSATRFVASVDNQSFEFLSSEDEFVARRADHILFDHRGAEVVRPVTEPELGNFWTLGENRKLDVCEIIQEDSGHREGAQVVEGRRLLFDLEIRLFRLERPRHERAER